MRRSMSEQVRLMLIEEREAWEHRCKTLEQRNLDLVNERDEYKHERDMWRELALNVVRKARDNRGHLSDRAYPPSVYAAMLEIVGAAGG